MAKDRKQTSESIFGEWDFTLTNYLLFLGGIIVILAAYIIMALGDKNSFQGLTLAPVMLVIGYLVIIPLAIIYKPKKKSQKQKPS